MTLAEFNNNFDLLYNNSFSFSAPPINMYEKSLYLTQAQEDIVKDLYNNYDKNERSREQLRNVTVNKKIDFNPTLNSNLVGLKFNQNSKFFAVPSDVWFMLAEYINDNIIVIPTPIDEYNINIKNPYKWPQVNTRAWRLDVGNIVGNTMGLDNIREIVYPATISTYTIRYIKKPGPIILESLSSINKTIEGLTAATTCKLSDELHSNIIELAVKKAKLTYEENSLANRIQSDITTNRDK
jgi:hypothetical protein